MGEIDAARSGHRLRLGRVLFIAIVATVVALALSESARSKLLDLLFGAEEQFEYTPAGPAGAPDNHEGAAAA